MQRIYLLVLLALAALPVSSFAQTPAVQDIRFENGTRRAYVAIANLSNQDITGFVLSLDVLYQNGQTEHWLRLVDMVHAMLDQKKLGRPEGLGAFRAGRRKEIEVELPEREGKYPAVTLWATLLVIAYGDKTVDDRNDRENAIDRLIAFRQSGALAARKTAETINEVANQATPDPRGMAIEKLRALSQGKSKEEYDSTRMLITIEALERMGNAGTSELRDYATQQLNDAAFLSAHTQLRRAQ